MRNFSVLLILSIGFISGAIIYSNATFKKESHETFDGITKATKSGKSKNLS